MIFSKPLSYFIFPVTIICAFAMHSNAQTISRSIICTGGETVTNPQLSLTYAIGEPAADLLSSSEELKYLTVGFEQPDIELKQILNPGIGELTVFPNPATNIVRIAMTNVPDANYSIGLIDITGRTLQTINVNLSNSNYPYVEINVAQYAPGTYVIHVQSDKYFEGRAKLIKQ
jgi:hypothetical protein